MTQAPQPTDQTDSWKLRTYVVGVLVGAGLGFLSAYLFAKEAEDDEPPEVAPSTLLGLALSVLALVRQIGESAKKKDK